MSEDSMEKYGVQTEEPPKTAASGEPKCPVCGALVEISDRSNVPRCPSCGTAPFEKKP